MNREKIRAAEKAIVGDLLTCNQGYVDLLHICDTCGGRFAGTEGEKNAADFMARKFEEYGLENVHKEEFEYRGWERGKARLMTTSPELREFACISLPYNTGSVIESELFYVGNGTPDDFEIAGEKIKGKIVLCSAKSPSQYHRHVHRGEKIGRAAAGGAIGLIWMRWDIGMLEETGSAGWGKPSPIPCISVSREVGEAIIRMQAKGPVKVRVETEDKMVPCVSSNVVGEITGKVHPDKVIVIGGHIDGHDISPSAVDNGTGIAVILEVARVLAQHKDCIGKTLRFVGFGAEEIGSLGSLNYVNSHMDELDNIEFMFNLDGAGRPMTVHGITLADKWLELHPYFAEIANDMKRPVPVITSISLYSDHLPFQLQGVPAGNLADLGDKAPSATRGFMHTAADTMDKVSSLAVQESSAFVARVCLHMAAKDHWPAKRKSKEEIDSMLGEYAEVMRFEGRWPFDEYVESLLKESKWK